MKKVLLAIVCLTSIGPYFWYTAIAGSQPSPVSVAGQPARLEQRDDQDNLEKWPLVSRLEMKIDRVAAAAQGVDVHKVGAVLEKLPRDKEFHLRDVLSLPMPTEDGRTVPLDRIAEVDVILKSRATK